MHMTVKHLENKQVRPIWASFRPHTNVSNITRREQRPLLLAKKCKQPLRSSETLQYQMNWDNFRNKTKKVSPTGKFCQHKCNSNTDCKPEFWN